MIRVEGADHLQSVPNPRKWPPCRPAPPRVPGEEYLRFQRTHADRACARDRRQMGWLVRSGRIQRYAVAEIKLAGGNAYYDWEWNDGKAIYGGVPRWPKWLVDGFGVDYFRHVVTVSTADPASLMSQVEKLTRLEELNFNGRDLNDLDLVHVDGLYNLTKSMPRRHSCHRCRFDPHRGADQPEGSGA